MIIQLPVKQKSQIIANLKRNWYFPISAMAFFCLSIYKSLGYCIGLPIAFVMMIVFASQSSSIWGYVKKHTAGEKFFCFASAVGICLGNQTVFYEKILKITSTFSLPLIFNKLILLVSYFGAIFALIFVFFCILFFWQALKRIILENNIGKGIKKTEWVIYGILILISLGFMIYSFSHSQAFYGTKFNYDIIYTSDSPILAKKNVYLVLTHPENDLRQPLFAVFSAPFIGIPYLIARLVGACQSVQAILINSVQIIMLFVANFMLAKMMKLDGLKRICFMMLTSVTYTQLLFTLMMEQYIVSYFWLVFCIYLIIEKKQADRIVLFGTGGTLLTSIALFPFSTDKSPIKNFKLWIVDMIKHATEFVVTMLAFCRFDVFFDIVPKISFLSTFTGEKVAFTDKIYQYTNFISDCFVSPDTCVKKYVSGRIAWQLNTPTSIDYVGIIILVLVVVSAILNRNKKSSIISLYWVAFSAIMLLGLGWGTKENGLILYSLYFGWAFLILLLQLVEKIEDKLNIRFLFPLVTLCATVSFLIINIPAIVEMVNFAIVNYPA